MKKITKIILSLQIKSTDKEEKKLPKSQKNTYLDNHFRLLSIPNRKRQLGKRYTQF